MQQIPIHPMESLYTCSVYCVLLESFFFFFGRVHVISTGPISAVQTRCQG
ncbi:unnamed protein product, partial [Staurois parvus]